jgi:hypothetical protein
MAPMCRHRRCDRDDDVDIGAIDSTCTKKCTCPRLLRAGRLVGEGATGKTMEHPLQLLIRNGPCTAHAPSAGSTTSFSRCTAITADHCAACCAPVSGTANMDVADAIKIAHPDHHPPERRELARRVTEGLLALQPFTFPAPKAKSAAPPAPAGPALKLFSEKVKRKAFPCSECADTTPWYYCRDCRAEWERRKEEKAVGARAKQREQYERRKERRDRWKPATSCAALGQRWVDGGGDCGGGRQEPADGPALASAVYGQGSRRAAEGRDPPVAGQAAEA